MAALADIGWTATVLRADLAGRTSATRDERLHATYAQSYLDIAVRLPRPPRRFPQFWRRQARPADGAEWVDAVVSAASQQLAGGDFDTLVTFGQPWSDHLAGLALRRRTRLPWIAHFSDPWVDNPFLRSVPPEVMAAWREQERAVVEQADRVLFTTDETRRLVMAKYPAGWGRRAATVPHMTDLQGSKFVPEPATLRAQPLLVYTGDFYGPRTPEGLLAALADLRRTDGEENCPRVEFIGRCGQFRDRATELGVAGLVTFTPQMGYADCVVRARQGDALLLIDAPSEISPFLASKLVDYLGIGKPILGLIPVGGVNAGVLGDAGCATVAPNDVGGIVGQLRGLMAQWRRGGLLAPASLATVAARYAPRSVAVRWDEILCACLRETAMASRRDATRSVG